MKNNKRKIFGIISYLMWDLCLIALALIGLHFAIESHSSFTILSYSIFIGLFFIGFFYWKWFFEKVYKDFED